MVGYPVNTSQDMDISSLDIVKLVSIVLQKIIAGNLVNQHHQQQQAAIARNDENFLKFRSSYVPDVTIVDYLDRIKRYSKCNDSCLVLVLVYMDRLIEKRFLHLTPLNIHRLLITSVMLAAKYHEDLFYNNSYFAQIGGLSLSELNVLETEMLTAMEFALYVSNSEYAKYVHHLITYSKSLVTPAPSLPTLFSVIPPNSQQQHGVGLTHSANGGPCVANFTNATCVNAFQFSPHSPTGHLPNQFSPTNMNHHTVSTHSANPITHPSSAFFPVVKNHNEAIAMYCHCSYTHNSNNIINHSYCKNNNHDNRLHDSNIVHVHGNYHPRAAKQMRMTTDNITQNIAINVNTNNSNSYSLQSTGVNSSFNPEYFAYHPVPVPAVSATCVGSSFPMQAAATMLLYNFTAPLGHNNNPYIYLPNFGGK